MFSRVIRVAQPRIEPAPEAVSANTIATTIASNTRSASIRGLGPPRMAPMIETTNDTVAAIVRPRRVRIRETSQPTTAATGSTTARSARMNHSVRVGCPSMSIVCLPVTTTTRAELSMNTATAASAGAERGQTRRTRAPGRSTAGSPRSRNQRSAARRCATSVMEGPPIRRLGELNYAHDAERAGHQQPNSRATPGAEGGHELACGRGALLLLGWHGRRLLPGVP